MLRDEQLLQEILSVRSVQYVHAVLRAGLQQAMREDLVIRNVAKLVQVEAPATGLIADSAPPRR